MKMKMGLSFDKNAKKLLFGATTISKATLSIMAKLRLSFCVEFCYAKSWNAEIRSLVIMLSAVIGVSLY